MPELRVDPLSGLRAVIADGRSERPGAWPAFAPVEELPEDDPFAEGNERATPPELWADRPDGSAPDTPGWRVRSVPNKFPALDQNLEGVPREDALGLAHGPAELEVVGPAPGFHEVIVNSPRAVRSLAELTLDELASVTAAWAARIAAHRGHAACTHVCVNERREAGATLAHTHSQLFALPFVPAAVARERERAHAFRDHNGGGCLLEEVVRELRRDGRRVVAEDESAVLFTPFASPTPYRMTIAPKTAEPDYDDSDDRGTQMLHAALRALQRVFTPDEEQAPPLNIWLRGAVRGAVGWSWRIEIAPRLGQPAGFELGTGTGLNAVAPEVAAARLRATLG